MSLSSLLIKSHIAGELRQSWRKRSEDIEEEKEESSYKEESSKEEANKNRANKKEKKIVRGCLICGQSWIREWHGQRGSVGQVGKRGRLKKGD
jgi:hypothetical protein